MKRALLYLSSFLLTAGIAFAHASAKLHLEDEANVFAGYGDDSNFKQLVSVVSGGIDNELPKMFRESIGSVPGNHRILGHGWTLNAAIPKKTMEKLLKRYPDKRDDIIKVWASFARNCKAKAEELTGLPKNQANALASMIYDIHLIGDLEPDNKLLDDVLSLEEIVRNYKKDAEELFINKPEYSELIGKKLDETMKLDMPMQEKATAVMQTLYDLRIGTMLHATWGKTLKMKYSADSNVNARQKDSEARQGAGVKEDKGTTRDTPRANTEGKSYWVSKTGKIHNSDCQYFKSGDGDLTDKPTGTNCKKCGGTSK